MKTSTREAFEKAGLPLTPMEAAYVGSAAIRMKNGPRTCPFSAPASRPEPSCVKATFFPSGTARCASARP